MIAIETTWDTAIAAVSQCRRAGAQQGSNQFDAKFHKVRLARPIGRNQTKARIALVSLGVGIGLDQPTVRGTANNAKNANHARAWPQT